VFLLMKCFLSLLSFRDLATKDVCACHVPSSNLSIDLNIDVFGGKLFTTVIVTQHEMTTKSVKGKKGIVLFASYQVRSLRSSDEDVLIFVKG
jgi:hypothetical protein